jgi:hypothetical protein
LTLLAKQPWFAPNKDLACGLRVSLFVKLSLSASGRPVPIDRIGVKEKHPRKTSSPRQSAKRHQRAEKGSSATFRKFCVIVLGAAAVATYATNQYQVRTEATIMARHLGAQLRALGASGTIHSNTVSYEQEVNRVTDRN